MGGVNFDMEATLQAMVAAFLGVVTEGGPQLQECVIKALAAEREALEAIALARLQGEIDDEGLARQLRKEEGALEAALLVCEIQTKALLQNAINAALEVFTAAISRTLLAAL